MASSLNTPEHLEKLRNEAALKSINEGRKNKGQKPLDKLPAAMIQKSKERLKKAKGGNKPPNTLPANPKNGTKPKNGIKPKNGTNTPTKKTWDYEEAKRRQLKTQAAWDDMFKKYDRSGRPKN